MMRPVISLNILLLILSYPSLIHSFLGLRLDYNDTPRRLHGCHCPAITFETYIHFYEPRDKTWVYAISTTWKNTYDSIIRKALPAHGFVLLSTPSVNSSELCHWKELDRVTVAGVHRGDISYREMFASTVQNHHVPRTEARRPSNDTLLRIRSILLSNAPTHDLLMLTLGYTLPFLGIALLLGPLWYIAHRRQEPCVTEGIDIELSSINAPNTSDQSTLDLMLPEKAKMKDDRLWSSSYSSSGDPKSSRALRNQLDGLC